MHVAFGFVGLAAFWIPIFAKKGGKWHIAVGHIFVWCAYAGSVTALGGLGFHIAARVTQRQPPATYDFVVLLAYLSIITLALARHAARVVQTRKNPELLSTPGHRALLRASQVSSLLAVAFAILVPTPMRWVLVGMSPIGLVTGHQMLRFTKDPTREHMGWLYEHIGAILGTGIAFHTAFAVFGFSRLFGGGPAGLIVWLAPTVVGIPAIAIWTAHYRRKFAKSAA